jgi:hypothetical protein
VSLEERRKDWPCSDRARASYASINLAFNIGGGDRFARKRERIRSGSMERAIILFVRTDVVMHELIKFLVKITSEKQNRTRPKQIVVCAYERVRTLRFVAANSERSTPRVAPLWGDSGGDSETLA